MKLSKLTHLTTGSLIALATLETGAQAMPSNSKANPALVSPLSQQITAQKGLYGSKVLIDETSRLLYVSPAERKTQKGSYTPLGYVVNCSTLKAGYELLYRLPPVDQALRIAKEGPYSPFFDLSYGLYISNASLLREVKSKMMAISDIQTAAFTSSEIIYNELHVDLTAVSAKLDSLDTAIDTAFKHSDLATTTDEESRAKQALVEARAEKAARAPELKEKLRALEARFVTASADYIRAKAIWTNYDVQIKPLLEAVNGINAAFGVEMLLAKDAFKEAKLMLDNLESKIVGLAAAGYTIWDNEASLLRDIVSRNSTDASGQPVQPYSVNQLSLYNVALKPVLMRNVANTAAHTDVSYTASTPLFDERDKDKEMTTTFKDAAGNPIKIAYHPAPNQGAGVYMALITEGAYCGGGSSEPQLQRVSLPGSSDTPIVFGVPVFENHESDMLFHQPVALSYDFNVRAEPINVKCSLHVHNFMQLTRDSGSSQFLFWGHQWDDTTRNLTKNNGVSCTVLDNVTGDQEGLEEHKQYVQALQQKMSQEVMAEFILNYAKAWTVTSNPPPAAPPANPFPNLGNGMAMLCGSNAYCAIGSIILKNADELFGQHNGRTSDTSTMDGTITRDYTEISYTVQHGEAIIDLEVRKN